MKVSDLIGEGDGLRDVKYTKAFEKELKDFRSNPQVLKNLISFKQDRSNDTKPWGKKDERMHGPMANFYHAHLVYGKAILIYKMDSKVLYLLALHDHKAIDRIGSMSGIDLANRVSKTFGSLSEGCGIELVENRIMDYVMGVAELCKTTDPKLVSASFNSYTFETPSGTRVTLRPFESRRATLPLSLTRRISVPSRATAEDAMDGIRISLGNGPRRVSPAFVTTVVNASLSKEYLDMVDEQKRKVSAGA
jgi:mRNA-degrading endonuclease YafQ of YafQ-DinJ toxin-antitoxin module